jgi:chromosomal replication initiation ATPase DnaA
MLDSRFRFVTFVAGPSNRLALAAGQAVAEAPGRVYHPLFLYAESGLGKTHLLTAVGIHALQVDPTTTVVYVAAAEYATQRRVAAAQGELNAWRRQWDAIPIVLLDDVEQLAGDADTQAELIRLIDQAQGNGFQVVMTANRPPADLDTLDQRLVTRMSSGLVTDIAAPELETKLGILWLWRSVRAVDIDDGTLDEVAHQGVANVRELLDLFNRIAEQRELEPGTTTDRVVGALIGHAPPETPDEFESFLHDVSAVVSSSVEQWRNRLASAVARWAGEGYSTASLEGFLDGTEAPDLDAVETRFAAAVNQLRDLESEAARLDPRLAGVSVFKDPERLDEARAIVMRALAAYDPPPAPAEHLTINALAPGARNQLALRAAGEVIALPGSRYNPLFIHGPPSSGRTHLAHAIGNALMGRDGEAWTVAVVDGAALADELIEAMRAGLLDRWRMRYRAADAIVVDNVHRIGGSDRLQDEFGHLFDAFVEDGRQVVLTADAPPPQLDTVTPDLQSRFASGLVVEVGTVSEAEAVARHTPVPDGAEAAAPTIDAWFDDVLEPEPERLAHMEASSAIDSFFLDPEKVVTEWLGLTGRVVEDPR